MKLRIFNSESREKEDFIPLDPAGKKVGLYVCGPTVYDFIHIGNARPIVMFDILYRVLNNLYDDVTYVRNITDVDDKINNRAAENGESIRDLTERTAAQFREDALSLGSLVPDHEPRATENIPQMIALIERLIENGHAYAESGHVLFSVKSWDGYGKFARKSYDDQVAGARVEVAPYKRDAADFVLWKPSGDGIPGWDSPWGYGRPGWHIECSAMSERYLGPDFDIHAGGQDLIFPHHQNEIAQSCCGNKGSSYAKYWMHNGYLMSEGEKMSKSLGNFYTVRELLEEYPGEALRLVILQTHYRQPLDFSKDKCREAKGVLDKIYGALRDVKVEPTQFADIPDVTAALLDDLNTPKAMSALHELVGEVNKSEGEAKSDAASRLLAAGQILGLLGQDPESWFQGGAVDAEASEIDALVEERKMAKANKDFARADAIRGELTERGIVLEDKPGGVTVWRKA